MSMTLSSSAFGHNQSMPARHTCDGANTSPPLAWSGVPPGTKSLALIVDDPDAPDPAAPKMTWVHWALYNVPPTVNALPEGVTGRSLPGGAHQGMNDWHRIGYGGPCPPVGQHRYFFKLYALDTVLRDLSNPSKTALEEAMEGHVLARAEIIGLYQH